MPSSCAFHGTDRVTGMTQISDQKIAVIGAGLIGRKHIEVVSQHANVSAVIDPSDAAEQLAKDRNISWFPDLSEYLGTEKPDGAIVASPNQLHLEHGAACMAAGVPVLIEKPLAESADNAAKLARISAETGVPVLVGHHRRHSPLVKAAKAAIEAGTLGRITAVTAQFWLYKPQDYFNVTWRKSEGGGPVFINLIHDIDLLRHFCGEVASVQSMESHAVRDLDVEDTAALILRFQSGALATVSISDTVVAPWSWELTAGENPAYPKTSMSCYQIGGTQASLSVPDLRLWRHQGAKSWWSPIEENTLPVANADPVDLQFRHFQEVIAGRVAPLVPASEGARTLRVLGAIKRAAQHGGTELVAD